MLPLTELRRRIEVQGFTGLTDEEIAETEPWFRFTPVMNALSVGLATLTGSVPLLVVLAGAMALGAALPRHPFDWIYNGMIRPLEESPRLPRSGWRRRVVFLGGVPWLLLLAWLFHTGRHFPATAIGLATTGMILLLAIAHICIPSEMMDRMSGKKKAGAPSGPSRPVPR